MTVIKRTGRGRGNHAGLNVGKIVDVARELPPDKLTITAVADRLGVDRKAINHHVTSRDVLLSLVAADAFSKRYSSVDLSQREDWKEYCRAYAFRFTDSIFATGVFASYIDFGNMSRAHDYLRAAEQMIDQFIRAGFTQEQAVRLLAHLTNLCIVHARDAMSATTHEGHTRRDLLRAALVDKDPAEFPRLTAVAHAAVDTYGSEQLELDIQLFLDGAAALLAGHVTRSSS